MTARRLLIDHDILLYRALWGAKDQGYYRQLATCEYMVEKILSRFPRYDYTLIMSGSGNFRYKLFPEYKANRKNQPKPFYLYDAKNYFQKYWDATVSIDCEADDVIGMAHEDDSTIVVSSDKDFLQLGGLIYNPFTNVLNNIKNPEFFFYRQMLVGDSVDNIEGLPNPAKAHHKIPPNFTDGTAGEVLAGLNTDQMRETVKEMYLAEYGDLSHFTMNAKLLFLKRAYADEYNQIF